MSDNKLYLTQASLVTADSVHLDSSLLIESGGFQRSILYMWKRVVPKSD